MNSKYNNLVNIVYDQIAYKSPVVKKSILLALTNVLKNISTEDYVKSEYNKIMQKWIKETGNVFEVPNGSISFSINDNKKIVNLGKASNNDLYDIASMTKLYTELILFKMMDEYNFSLDMPIKDINLYNGLKGKDLYANLFENMTIKELLAFSNTFETQKNITDGKSFEEARSILRTARALPEKRSVYKYTDFPIMITSDLLENISGLKYEELLGKYILKEYNLKNTYYYNVPEDKKNLYTGLNKNGVNDSKANAIYGGGHAGIITSPDDLTSFLTNIIPDLKDNFKYFITPSEANYYDGSRAQDVAMIGNSNINSIDDIGALARNTLPKAGFYVQGSTRVDGDSAAFKYNNKDYYSSANILIDVASQLENLVDYIVQKNNLSKSSDEYIASLYSNMPDDEFSLIAKDFIKETYYENRGVFITTDLRKLLKYGGGFFTELKDMAGVARIMLFYETLIKEYGIDFLINNSNEKHR